MSLVRSFLTNLMWPGHEKRRLQPCTTRKGLTFYLVVKETPASIYIVDVVGCKLHSLLVSRIVRANHGLGCMNRKLLRIASCTWFTASSQSK